MEERSLLEQQLQCLTAQLVAAPAFSWRVPNVDGERNGNPKMSCGISGKNLVGLVLAEVYNSEAFSQLCLSFFILLRYQKEVLPPNCGMGQCEQLCSLSWHLRQKEA